MSASLEPGNTGGATSSSQPTGLWTYGEPPEIPYVGGYCDVNKSTNSFLNDMGQNERWSDLEHRARMDRSPTLTKPTRATGQPTTEVERPSEGRTDYDTSTGPEQDVRDLTRLIARLTASGYMTTGTARSVEQEVTNNSGVVAGASAAAPARQRTSSRNRDSSSGADRQRRPEGVGSRHTRHPPSVSVLQWGRGCQHQGGRRGLHEVEVRR